MNGFKRRTLRITCGALALFAGVTTGASALAQGYPEKPIRLINPWAPGGSADVISRLVGQRMTEDLRRPIVVDNRAGAGGTIGSDLVAKSPPDGYTLIFATVASHAIATSLYKKLPYNALTDFEHVGLIGTMPNALLVGASFPAKNFNDFIAVLKSKPGALTFGSAGNGSSPHLSAEMLKSMADITATHVPYKGAGPALQALIGGEVSFLFENIATIAEYVKSGKLRALGTTGAVRSQMLPNVPTLREQGLPNYVAESWSGLSAPAGTPEAVVTRLNASLRAALEEPALRARLVDLGVTPTPLTPAQYRDFIRLEIDKWKTVVEASGAKID